MYVQIYNQLELIVYKKLTINFVITVLESVKNVLILIQQLALNAIQDLTYMILLVLNIVLIIIPIKILLIILV